MMKLVAYRGPSGASVAAVKGDWLVDLHDADPSLPTDMKELLALGVEGLQRAQRASTAGRPISSAPEAFLPVVPRPEKIICVGLNYSDHARETGATPPPCPVIFSKFPTAINAHDQPIILPRVSKEVDYEAELAVVIGRGGRDISEEKAREHVAGYCCANDVSARDWQIRKPGGQWLLGKSFDSFAPVGPVLTTADEIDDPGNLRIQLRLNGQTMQDSSTAQLIFGVDELIAYVSTVCHLSPGDLIFTGTPGGVGFMRQPPVFLKAGDAVEVEIDKLGVLRNPVIAAC
jgi:2-keto-4-pentenoate hydratase/2-oxohepta-3-ene-1,7-dioic acid hydratase in catechol pathway